MDRNCLISSCFSRTRKEKQWHLWRRSFGLWTSMVCKMGWSFRWSISTLPPSIRIFRTAVQLRSTWWVRKPTTSCLITSGNGSITSCLRIHRSSNHCLETLKSVIPSTSIPLPTRWTLECDANWKTEREDRSDTWAKCHNWALDGSLEWNSMTNKKA